MRLGIHLFILFLAYYALIYTGLLQKGLIVYAILFVLSGFLLLRAANIMTDGILRLAHFLQWREFVVAFFVMAVGSSMPGLFVGLFSAFKGIPELSFGDITGNNVTDLTVVAALAPLFGKEILSESKVAQNSALFTAIVAILPMFMILDGTLGRGDGIVLILIFLFYSRWLFSKRELYDQHVEHPEKPHYEGFKTLLGEGVRILLGFAMILASANGAVQATQYFAVYFSVPLFLIGILVLGVGSSLPETYFTIAAARRGQDWVVLGELMGSVVVPATLILGIVALIHPIVVTDPSPYVIARFVLTIAAFFFYIFIRTGQKLTRKEGLLLITLYLAYVFAEVAMHSNLF